MGYSSWDSSTWDTYSSSTSKKTRDEVFTADSVYRGPDPSKPDPKTSLSLKDFEFRESRDSKTHPESTPVIVGFDVTGSMGDIPDYFVKKGLGVAFEEIIDRKPVKDPQLLTLAIGDAAYDREPLQATQFETDLTAAKQLEKFYLESGGGGNNVESYELAWYFAATRTRTDAVEKGRRKGVLFTIGDECLGKTLPASHIAKVFGDKVQGDIPMADLYKQVSQTYDVFHIIIAQGDYARGNLDQVKKSWQKVLGQNVLVCSDYTKLSEILVSVLQVHEGSDPAAVAKSWKSTGTSLVVAEAVKDMAPGRALAKTGSSAGVRRLEAKR